MAATDYTYSISEDFPNGKVNSDTLTVEIQDSSIVTALDKINTAGDVCDIWFKDALSSGDQTTLDAVVAAHQGNAPPWHPTTADGSPIIHIDSSQEDGSVLTARSPRLGDELTASTHSFCDETTWYSTSVRVTEETMTDSGNQLLFTVPSGNKPWVDLDHGKVLWEEDVNADHLVVVTVDDVVKTEDPMYGDTADYSVDYVNGTVTFHTEQTGTVKVSYSHVQDSQYILKPAAGKMYELSDAEIQFSSDLSYNDCVRVAPWGYAAVFAPELVPPLAPDDLVELAPRVRRYKRHDQILDEAHGTYPAIGTIGGPGGCTSQRYGYPLPYMTATLLYATYGMELRVSLENDIVFGGERSTVTFYGVIKDEPEGL
jgi:hypothetical protein